MLYRAPAQFLKGGQIARRYAHTVVVMRYYPRFVPKTLVDEYARELAPAKDLFADFKASDRQLKDHDRAFESVSYEDRFTPDPDAPESLERLSLLSRGRDVFLICQCLPLQRCHADLLLLLARHWFNADTQQLRVRYPVFTERIARGEFPFQGRS